ncbi:MAG: class I SAM-dependent methyltransferase [Ardenticatenaceae bacterium]|nr:class I SAM-dependent methyltransferase [Ardenticatenaceae bacterium]
MNQKTMRYRQHWDSYWRHIVDNNLQGRVLWESEPERFAGEEIERFRPFINQDLPLLDLGCGSGKQTSFMAQHFNRVIGVDVSPAVVDHARQSNDDNGRVDWRVFNALNADEAVALHDEIGDMNIYVRGVFHVIDKKDREQFVSTIETLLGTEGTLYLIELTVEALTYVRSINRDGSIRFPKVVQPTGFNNASDQESYFPSERWELLASGEDVSLPTIPLEDGKVGAVPANYLVLRRKI